MSLTYKPSSDALPIAKIEGTDKVIYLMPDSTEFQNLNVNKKPFICPYCKRELASKKTLINHLDICPKKNQKREIMPSIQIPEYERLVIIPPKLTEHDIIMLTGKPKCGKTYLTNEIVKAFHKIYKFPVFRVSRVVRDETLKDDDELYNNIYVDENFIKDIPAAEDFYDCMVIFDDIENAKFPKATKAAYGLLDDICKNGRHSNNTLMFCNQESRMGHKTKGILSTITKLIIFPKNQSAYQTERLLKDHIGMSKVQIKQALGLNSRWVMINVAIPQYVMHEHGVYLLGKEHF